MFNLKLFTPMFLMALAIGSATALHATPAHAAMCQIPYGPTWICSGEDDGIWACEGGDKEACGELSGDWDGVSACLFKGRPGRCE